MTYPITSTDITDQTPLTSRIELGDSDSAWFHLTKGEADYLQACMAEAPLTAEEAGYTGTGTGEMIADHHWAITQDAAWTCIVDGGRDVLCQVIHDGRLENVVVHPDGGNN